MTATPLSADERARCATMARWLAASSVLGALALCCALVAALGFLAQAWRDEAMGFALLALASVPVERYLALRIRFDAGLFADLASGRIADLAGIDAGLAILGVGGAGTPSRTLDQRLSGSRRLWRRHAVATLLLAASTAVAVVFA